MRYLIFSLFPIYPFVVDGFGDQMITDRKVSGLFHKFEALNCQKEDNSPIELSGPIGLLNEMEVGFHLEELGLSLMVGKSSVAKDKGVFLSLSDEGIEEVTIPLGTILCGYSRGEFKQFSEEDKTVLCQFNDLSSSVIFNQEILPLREVIETVSGENLTNLGDGLPNQIRSIVRDHQLDLVNSSAVIYPVPLSSSVKFCFIPFAVNGSSSQISIANAGCFTNDLAFDRNNPFLNKSKYQTHSRRMNIAKLIWRFEWDSHQLFPTWPVVIFSKDIVIRNHEPVEIGLEYGWRYWEALNSLSRSPQKNDAMHIKNRSNKRRRLFN